MIVHKIMSGGQTGVDRAALDFALKYGIPCGGWCPKGRQAEDGPIDAKYPLVETSTSMYVVRTRLNVDDTDGTLILYDSELGNGTQYTAEYAISKHKPLLMINVKQDHHGSKVYQWLKENEIRVLNIAGPRESTSPGIHRKALAYLENILSAGE